MRKLNKWIPVGKAQIQEQPNGRWKYRCRQERLGVKEIRTVNTRKEAEVRATELTAMCFKGEQIDPKERKDIDRVFSNFKIERELKGEIVLPPGSIDDVIDSHKATFCDDREMGGRVNRLHARYNKQRISLGMPALNQESLLMLFDQILANELSKSTKPKMKILLRDFLKYKLSKGGGRGGDDLGGRRKKDYISQAKKVTGWIGEISSAETPKLMRDTMKNHIVHAVSKANKNKGEPLGKRSRRKYADFVQTMGKWIAEEKPEIWPHNYFENFANNYTSEKNTRVAPIFVPKEVEKLFEIASQGKYRMIIPYITFLYFSTVRPSELARKSDDGLNRDLRFDWSQMLDWKVESTVTGGLQFQIYQFVGKDRMSKTPDRHAELFPNGVEWMRWWSNSEGIELPTSGTIQFEPHIWKKVRNESGLFDDGEKADIARHSASSYSEFFEGFSLPPNKPNYWIRVFGHEVGIRERHYLNIKANNQELCNAYFNILPRGAEPKKDVERPLVKVA